MFLTFCTEFHIALKIEDLRRVSKIGLCESEESEDEELLCELETELDDEQTDLLSLSFLCLLHSLCRSVNQLRTKFLDKSICAAIIELVKQSQQKWSEKMLLVKRRRFSKLEQIEQEKTLKSIRISKKRDFVCIQNENEEMNKEITNEDEMDEDEDSDYIDAEYCGSLSEQSFISVLTAILANLLLEFSPCREVSFFSKFILDFQL